MSHPLARYSTDFEAARKIGFDRGAFREDADLQQAKTLMASAIIKILAERRWTTRKAEAATGMPTSHAFVASNSIASPLDRLMNILTQLGQGVELSVHVRPRREAA